ncbi:PD-(D/E)XK motif protein [Bordetella trematum]|uniref:PD-(D/E)XK motif protein n=1 Tax=Bordetella trematum TaxID=123899 RepID=UPI003AF39228
MTLPTDELTLAWRSLAISSDIDDGWRSITISPAGAAVVRAGLRFPGGLEAILVRFAVSSLPATLKLPEGGGFFIDRVSVEDGMTWVALTRRELASRDLFAAMAHDVVAALSACSVSDEHKTLAILLGRVRAWQEFMRKGGEPLSAEAEIGLLGELILLRGMLDEGVDVATACLAWQGPLGGLRDFELGTGALEVKSTLSSTGFPARIGRLEQLDDTDRQPLFLAAIRLSQSQMGMSLPEAVEIARDIVLGDAEGERLLIERLVACGYQDAHADRYCRRFNVVETRILRVGEGFPRLTPYSVPNGVRQASYEIDIDLATTETVGLSDALIELKAI